MTKILLDAGPSRKGWHRIETFLRCPQMFAYRYRLGLRGAEAATEKVTGVATPPAPKSGTFHFSLGKADGGKVQSTVTVKKKPNALERGSIIHVGLAQHYARVRAQQQGGIEDVYYTPREGVFMTCERLGLDTETAEHFFQIVCAYQAHYMFDRSAVLEVEQERLFWFHPDGSIESRPLDSPPPPPGVIDLTTRWDRVCRATDGRTYIHDLKTTASPTTNATNVYSMSGQMLLAQELGRTVWGAEFGGVVVDLIPLDEAKPPQRVPLMPAPHAARKAASTLRWAEGQIEALADVDPWQWPQAMNELMCCHRYGVCDYSLLCQRGPKGGGGTAA